MVFSVYVIVHVICYFIFLFVSHFLLFDSLIVCDILTRLLSVLSADDTAAKTVTLYPVCRKEFLLYLYPVLHCVINFLLCNCNDSCKAEINSNMTNAHT